MGVLCAAQHAMNFLGLYGLSIWQYFFLSIDNMLLMNEKNIIVQTILTVNLAFCTWFFNFQNHIDVVVIFIILLKLTVGENVENHLHGVQCSKFLTKVPAFITAPHHSTYFP